MINTDPRVSVDFTCKYTADYTTEQASVATSPDNVTKHLMSQGMFAYSLKAGLKIFFLKFNSYVFKQDYFGQTYPKYDAAVKSICQDIF